MASMNAKQKLPKWVSSMHRAWLELGDRCALQSDLVRLMGVSLVQLQELNIEFGGGHDNGWFISEVTVPRVEAGDKLWSYLNTLRREFNVGG